MSHVKTDKLSARTASGTITLGESGETFALGSGATVDSGFTPAAISINASASSGALAIDASDNLQFDSGYGSTATAYGCRAWVNFNGTGTVAIRESANVSSITDHATGDYTINFSTAMPDANYVTVGTTGSDPITFDSTGGPLLAIETFSTGSVRIATGYTYSVGYFAANDWSQNCVGIIR